MQKTPQNHLLGLLPDSELDLILPYLEPVALSFRQLVYGLNEPIEYAYFPEDGVISLVGVTQEGTAVEVATIGNEGMVGVPLFLGAERVIGQAFSQVPGAAFRLKAELFQTFSAKGKFHQVMNLYTQALFTQVAQSAACNRLHLTEERFARWLLLTHDRVAKDVFPLTQDFISQMLGVRRATVSQIAARFQNEGLISYSRGVMTIVDRKGVEQEACECYSIIRADFERLLGRPETNPRLFTRVELPNYAEEGKSTVTDGTPRAEREAPRRRAK
jgi:CRP-like cAMP-binding protein